MMMESKPSQHCHHSEDQTVSNKKKERAGLFSSLLLILLPKCPFCLAAYSSTVMLCENGAGMKMDSASPLTLAIAIVFCAIVMLSILLNYRDERSKYALAFAAAGSAIIIFSVIINGGMILYYSGIALLFTGAWLNASLLSILRKIRQRLERITIS